MAPMNPIKETGREGGWGVDKAVDCRIQIHHLAPRIADSCAPASPGVGKALESTGESTRARRGDREVQCGARYIASLTPLQC